MKWLCDWPSCSTWMASMGAGCSSLMPHRAPQWQAALGGLNHSNHWQALAQSAKVEQLTACSAAAAISSY
jgi:hypothetical protein